MATHFDHHDNLRRFNETAIETFMPDEDAQPRVRLTILKPSPLTGPYTLTPDFCVLAPDDIPTTTPPKRNTE